MSEFKLEPAALQDALEYSLLGVTQFIQTEAVKDAPRDRKRMPMDINRKDGKAPQRSTYYKPVRIGGNWYAGVSGKLKQSITHQIVSPLETKVGVQRGTTEEYGKAQEFGTRRMRPRSYLRKAIIDNRAQALALFKKLFSSRL